MSSAFDALEDAVSAACDALFAETFELRPMRSAPNVRAVADANREIQTFQAIFDDRARHQEAAGGGMTDFKRISVGRDDTRTTLSVDNAELARIDRRAGDRVLRVKTGVLYELGNPMPDGMGRTVFNLRHIQINAG